MNNNTFVHKYIKPLIKPDSVCVDMTLGNGNDALLLCQLAKKVYGFDISSQAIINSKKRLSDYTNITFINDNHINVLNYINEKVDLIIFNLGYLPHSDDPNITKANETLIAFKNAFQILNNNGYIIITFYVGHPGGKDEYYLLFDYIKNNDLKVLETYKQDKLDSPITFIIKK